MARAKKPKKTMENVGFKIGIFEILAVAIISILIAIYSRQLANYFREWSYFGVFFLSLLASASVFVPTAPLQFAVIYLGRLLDPLFFAIVAGTGSGIGEITAYAVGSGSEKILESKNKMVRNFVNSQQRFVKKYSGIAIFLLAAMPNPFFDVAGIAAGLMKMKWWEFLLWCIAGRIVRYAILGWFGVWAFGWA